MPAMTKAALKGVRLNRERSRGHEPRTVGQLISQEPLHARLVDCVGRRNISRNM